VKRLFPSLLLASLLLTVASIGAAQASTEQTAEAVSATCPWRKALVSHDREIQVAGTTAAVEFEVADGCTVFDPSLADQQKLFAAETNVYGSGEHRVEVPLPDCYWQVDFVAGKPIHDLSPTNLYGPRRIAGQSGGKACVGSTTSTTTPPPSSTVGTTTTTAVLGATSTSTPGTLPFTGAGAGASAPMLFLGIGLLVGGLLILLVSRRGRVIR
jgi:hypothetical protein